MGILWSVFVQHTSQSVWKLFLTRWEKEDESGGVKFTKYYRSSHTRANCKCELVSSPCVNGTSLLGTIYRLIRPASGAAMRVTSLSCQAVAPLLASRDTKDKRPRADDGIERPPPPPPPPSPVLEQHSHSQHLWPPCRWLHQAHGPERLLARQG